MPRYPTSATAVLDVPSQWNAPAFQPWAVPQPLMAPNYVVPYNGAMHFTESWDNGAVTQVCYTSADSLSRCLDAVVRGGLSLLTPVVGTSGTPETLLPAEAAYLSASMADAGFPRM